MFGFVIAVFCNDSRVGCVSRGQCPTHRAFPMCSSFQILIQTWFSVTAGELLAYGTQWKLFHWLQWKKSSPPVSEPWSSISVASGVFRWQKGVNAQSAREWLGSHDDKSRTWLNGCFSVFRENIDLWIAKNNSWGLGSFSCLIMVPCFCRSKTQMLPKWKWGEAWETCRAVICLHSY